MPTTFVGMLIALLESLYLHLFPDSRRHHAVVLRGDTAALEVIPPRAAGMTPAGIERMLPTLQSLPIFSFGLDRGPKGCRYLIRTRKRDMDYLINQLRAAYPQTEFRAIADDDDPSSPRVSRGMRRVTLALHQRQSPALPLYVPDLEEYAQGDPLAGPLGALAGCPDGIRVHAELVLAKAPDHHVAGWSRYIIRQRSQSSGGLEQRAALRQGLTALPAVLGAATAIVAGVWIRLAAPDCGVLGFLISACFAAAGATLTAMVHNVFAAYPALDPDQVEKKISTSALFDACLRITAIAPSREEALRQALRLASAYHAYDSQAGNGLEVSADLYDDENLWIPATSWVKRVENWTSNALFNAAEVAALWHFAASPTTAMLKHTVTSKLTPTRLADAGVRLGRLETAAGHPDFKLERASLFGHSLFVGRSQSGKSALMAEMALAGMQENAGVVVLDPHGDLVRGLLPRIPTERLQDVIYLDLADAERAAGLNLLSVKSGRTPEQLVSTVIHAGSLVWAEFWGPRMENVLVMAQRVLISANQILVAQGKKEFTLLDVLFFLRFPRLRHEIIERYVSDLSVRAFWEKDFDLMTPSRQQEVIDPAMSKLNRLYEHRLVRAVLGQSDSTIDFREIVAAGKILLLNLAAADLGPVAANLLATFLVDNLNFALREQARFADRSQRRKVVLVVDEFQSTPSVDYSAMMAEVAKFGGSLVLATQSILALDDIDRSWRRTILANIANLFVFQSSAEDAEFLLHELDEAVEATDIINLPRYRCYVKTSADGCRLPAVSMDTFPPAAGDPEIAQAITRQKSRYTRSSEEVARERAMFEEWWYHRGGSA